MQGKHVILRVRGANTRDFGYLGYLESSRGSPRAELGLESFGTSAVSIEVDTLNASMLGDVKRERGVVAVAPVMPLKLIEPEATAQPSSFSSGAAWGIEATRAAQSPYSGDGITVAVLDTGIDRQHKAFDDKGLIIIEKNFTPDPDGSDGHGHGTHCAGTIFGRDVDGTRIGVARGVKRALIGKVLGTGGGQTDQIVHAIQWAVEQGADVISMSLGMDFPGYQKELESNNMPSQAATSLALEGYRLNVQLFERLAATYRSLGQFRQTATVLIAAGGNESKRPNYEIAVSPPAVSEGFISVAALAQTASGFAVAPFSNTGALVAAPGVSIVSAKRGGGLVAMSGTSMAAPHVAGVAALWAQKQQSIGPLTATLLSAKLIASGDTDRIDKPFTSGDVGSGLVQAPLT